MHIRADNPQTPRPNSLKICMGVPRVVLQLLYQFRFDPTNYRDFRPEIPKVISELKSCLF